VLQKPVEIVGIAVKYDAGSVQAVVRGASLTTSWSLFASSAKPAAVGLATRAIATCIVVELALSHKFCERFLMDGKREEGSNGTKTQFLKYTNTNLLLDLCILLGLFDRGR
jgi:hypothetical protein